MHRAWGVVATVAAAWALATVPLLLFVIGLDLGGAPGQVFLLPIACALLAGCLGWWSRPLWLAAPALVLGVAVTIFALVTTDEPCTAEFCEGFSPQAATVFSATFLVWPWQILGVVTGSLARHTANQARQRKEQGQPYPWVKETASLAAYLVAGLVGASLLINALQ